MGSSDHLNSPDIYIKGSLSNAVEESGCAHKASFTIQDVNEKNFIFSKKLSAALRKAYEITEAVTSNTN